MRLAGLIFLCLVSLLLAAVSPAWAFSLVDELLTGARVSGMVDLSYARYQAEEDGRELNDDSHFTQRYRLMANRKSLFNSGRAGYYTVGFGGEWASVAYDGLAESRSIDDFKLLYEGMLVFTPPNLPFVLNVYSHDVSAFSFGKVGTAQSVSPFGVEGPRLLAPEVVNDLNSGTTIVTGISFLGGIRNGSYLGQFRELLANLPRFLMDYKETYVDNTQSITNSMHYRDRKLAFISLNKKDNWFHYRFTDHIDYIDSDLNKSEQQVVLGTIDHVLRRQWINLTNWLQISADGSFSKRDEPKGGLDEEELLVNLFGLGRYNDWSFTSLNSYSRLRILDHSLERSLNMPFYLTGRPERDVVVRAMLSGQFEDQRFEALRNPQAADTPANRIPEEEDRTLYLQLQADISRIPRLMVTPRAAVETRRGTFGEGYGISGGLLVASNRQYRPINYWALEVGMTHLKGDGRNQDGVNYDEYQLRAEYERRLSDRVKAGLIQELVHGDGVLDETVTENISVEGNAALQGSNADTSGTSSGKSLRSSTTLFGEYASRRLKNRFEALYEFIDRSEGDREKRIAATHRIEFTDRKVRASLITTFLWGDSLESSISGSNALPQAQFSPEPGDWTLTTDGRLEYVANRSLSAQLDFRGEFDDGGRLNYVVGQKLTYHRYKVNGIVRRLFSLNQELRYNRQEGVFGTQDATMFKLAGKWYPRYNISLLGEMVYQYYRPYNFGQMISKVGLDFRFPLATLSLEYSYATRDESELFAERTEQLLELNVKKEI